MKIKQGLPVETGIDHKDRVHTDSCFKFDQFSKRK